MGEPAGFRVGKALWRSGAYDLPIEIVGYLGVANGIHYVSIKNSTTGIPFSEVVYPEDDTKPLRIKLDKTHRIEQFRVHTLGDEFAYLFDHRLRAAAQFAYNMFPPWRPIADQLVRARTRIFFLPPSAAKKLRENTLATGAPSGIRVHPRCESFHVVRLGEIIVHESIHATTTKKWGFEEELMAHTWGAQYWEACGSYCPEKDWWIDEQVKAFYGGRIREHILSVDAYRELYAPKIEPASSGSRDSGEYTAEGFAVG
jgi:hypothetical protein